MIKKKLSGLYAITDATQTDTRQLLADVEQALLGGARIIQYRDKSREKSRDNSRDKSQDPQHRHNIASALRELTHAHAALLIINDDPQLAKAVRADGVHLGQDDVNIQAARKLLGKNAIIGVSCYNRFELAQQASAQGADYIAFGRFFASRTKPQAALADIELLHQAQRELAIPVVAIGGITADNGGDLIRAGAHMLAVVDDIFGQADIKAAAQRYHKIFARTQLDQ
jgi:thiamine-phosphate pyrophosphorylase